MKTINLKEMRPDFLECEKCIANKECNKLFKTCVANFVKSINPVTDDIDAYHYKYCENNEWDTLNESEQINFTKILVRDGKLYSCDADDTGEVQDLSQMITENTVTEEPEKTQSNN